MQSQSRSRHLATLCLVAWPATRTTEQVPHTIFAPGVVSTDAYEYGLSATPSGDTVYFTRRADSRSTPRLWTAVRDSTGRWRDTGPVPFSTTEGDEYPSVSPDGRRLYFASRRPLQAGGPSGRFNRVWVSRREDGSWGKPSPVLIQGFEDRMASHPLEAPDGSLYFHSRDVTDPRDVDAYRAPPATSGFGTPQRLSFNSPAVDGEVSLAAAGDRLVFYSERPGGAGGGDLYGVMWVDGRWGPARNLGPTVNTGETEWTPSLSADGSQLYFARLSGNGAQSDIHMVSTPRLGVGRAPAVEYSEGRWWDGARFVPRTMYVRDGQFVTHPGRTVRTVTSRGFAR